MMWKMEADGGAHVAGRLGSVVEVVWADKHCRVVKWCVLSLFLHSVVGGIW